MTTKKKSAKRTRKTIINAQTGKPVTKAEVAERFVAKTLRQMASGDGYAIVENGGEVEALNNAADQLDEIARIVRKGLQSDSNDDEHDALVQIAVLLRVAYRDPEDFADDDLLAVIRSEYTLDPDWHWASYERVAQELREKDESTFEVELANIGPKTITLRVEGDEIVLAD